MSQKIFALVIIILILLVLQNAALRSDHRRILRSCQETTLSETTRKKDSGTQTQTYETSDEIYKNQYWSGGPSGIVEVCIVYLLVFLLRDLHYNVFMTLLIFVLCFVMKEYNQAVLQSKCRKLEQEKKMYKELCIKRKEKIDALENQLKQVQHLQIGRK